MQIETWYTNTAVLTQEKLKELKKMLIPQM